MGARACPLAEPSFASTAGSRVSVAASTKTTASMIPTLTERKAGLGTSITALSEIRDGQGGEDHGLARSVHRLGDRFLGRQPGPEERAAEAIDDEERVVDAEREREHQREVRRPDGSFQMVMNVLPVAAEYELGVTWCVLNDGALGSIRDIQQYRLHQRYIGTAFEVQPDFAAIAQACGCHGERVEDPGDMAGAAARALEANERGVPSVLDVIVAPERVIGTLEHYGFYPQELVQAAGASRCPA